MGGQRERVALVTMTPGAFVAIGAWGASVGFLAYSAIRDCVVRPRRRKREWRKAEEGRLSVMRHPLADSSWPDAPTLGQEQARLAGEARLTVGKNALREIGELNDLFALPAYRGRGH